WRTFYDGMGPRSRDDARGGSSRGKEKRERKGVGSLLRSEKAPDPNGVDFRPKLQPGKGLAKMACLARLRLTTLPDRKEAIHGSCYPHAPQPPSPPPPPATRPSPGA